MGNLTIAAKLVNNITKGMSSSKKKTHIGSTESIKSMDSFQASIYFWCNLAIIIEWKLMEVL